MDLHEDLMTYAFADWKMYALVHVLIDAGIATVLECQATPCRRDTREFAKSGHRGQGDLMVFDHIIMQKDGGSHRIENLRIVHASCNAGWRKGRPGTRHTDETKARLRETTMQAHADGRMKKAYTPERLAKIRQTKIERGQWAK